MEAVIANVSHEERTAKQLARAQDENARLRSLNRKLLKNTGMTFETSVDEFKAFLQSDPTRIFKAKFQPPAVHKPLVKSVFGKEHSETAVLLLSDWHAGEMVHPLEINGMNRYSPYILANRLWELTDTFMTIIRGHQSMYEVDKIWLPVLGDMISGSIHEELVLTNALLDYPSAVYAARLLILVVERLKTLGLPIEMDAVVGNHARQLEKMPTKKQAHTSLDWMVYVMVEEHFRGDEQVKTFVHPSQFALIEQRGHRIVLEHGAGYANDRMEEIDVRLRNIFDSPVYRKATGLSGTAVDLVIIGDKHRATIGPRYIVNGTVVGASELTTSWRLSPIKAEQVAFGISRKRPVTWSYALEMTECVSEDTKNPFSAYTAEFMKHHGR